VTLFLALAFGQDASTCTTSVSAAELAQVLADAEAAYIDLDEAAFLDHVDSAFIRTPCLDAPARSELAARIHRVVAVRRWAEAPEQAALSLRAAARAAPELGVDGLVGPSHPLARGWDPAPVRTERLAAPTHGELHLDGQPARRRAVDAPVLAQWVDGEHVRFTALLVPGASLPTYDAVPLARAPLRWTAAGTAVGAGALYGLAWSQSQRFDDPALDADTLRSVQARTNGLLVGSSGLLLASVTTGILSIVVR